MSYRLSAKMNLGMKINSNIKLEPIDDSYDKNEIIDYAKNEGYSPRKSSKTSDFMFCNRILPPPNKRVRFEDMTMQQPITSTLKCLTGPYRHYESTNANAMLLGLNEMRKRNKFVNLHLECNGKSIPCHKVVLCSASNYFLEEIQTLGPESNELIRLPIENTHIDVMTQLVEYAYTSSITITDKTIENILIAASKYQFLDVTKACLEILKQRVSPTNCISIKRFVAKQGFKKLLQHLKAYVNEHFIDISSVDDFKTQSLNELTELISSNYLNVNQEESVYAAVMDWVRYDVKTRKVHLPALLEHVKLPLLKPHFLLDVVQSEPLIKNHKQCEVYLDEARRFQLLFDQRPLMQSARTKPRFTYNSVNSEVLVVIGGLNKDKAPIQDCIYFDFPHVGHLAPFKGCQTAYSVSAVNNNIFVTGGSYHRPFKDVWMYIPSLDIWQQVSPMLTARYIHGSVGFKNWLYVVGGHDGSSRLNSAERYDPDSNNWHTVPDMLMHLSSPCVVSSEDHIYVIGGAKGPLTTDTVPDVQCYSPDLNQWKKIAPLPQAERGAIAQCLNGTIYVMGQHRSVFSYNRMSNVWMKLRDTNGGHLHGSATVHRGKLYIAGGLHGNSYINGTIEVYDQQNDTWRVTNTLHVPVYAAGLVSIFRDSRTMEK